MYSLYQLQINPVTGEEGFVLIAYGSKLMPKDILKLIISGKEGYAMSWSFLKEKDRLLPRPFVAVTDNQYLMYFYSNKASMDTVNAEKLMQLRETIAAFDFELRLAPTLDMPFTDFLNRIGEDGTIMEMRYKELQKNQQQKKEKKKQPPQIPLEKVVKMEFKPNAYKNKDEYINTQRTMIALFEIRRGNLEILENCIDLDYKLDDSNVEWDYSYNIQYQDYICYHIPVMCLV